MTVDRLVQATGCTPQVATLLVHACSDDVPVERLIAIVHMARAEALLDAAQSIAEDHPVAASRVAMRARQHRDGAIEHRNALADVLGFPRVGGS